MVNKSLGLNLALALMEIGKKSKTTLVLFFKYSTLIWKLSATVLLGNNTVSAKNNLRNHFQ